MKKIGLLLISLIIIVQIFGQETGSFTDSRDGKTYKTVKIGIQWWMAENLNYETDSGSWCCDDKKSYCDIYGRFYNWNTANNVCPTGWHLPNNKEWQVLFDYIGGNDSAGYKLRAKTNWTINDETILGIDSYGFTALPGGDVFGEGSCKYSTSYGFWWSAKSKSKSDAFAWFTISIDYFVYIEPHDKQLGISVRCLKD